MKKHDMTESVYFFTFHKCADKLFSDLVLKNVDGLLNRDYAFEIFSGKRRPQNNLRFQDNGFVYGPIRISADDKGPIYRNLVIPTIDHGFIKDKIALFLVRDPRDIMVASYYSFGASRELSTVKEIRRNQQARREKIRGQTLDEYVLDTVGRQKKLFGVLYDCLLYTSPSPRDATLSRMPSSA